MDHSVPSPENPPWVSYLTPPSRSVLGTPLHFNSMNRINEALASSNSSLIESSDAVELMTLPEPLHVHLLPILICSHSSFSLVYCLVALFTPGVSACRQTMGGAATPALSCLRD